MEWWFSINAGTGEQIQMYWREDKHSSLHHIDTIDRIYLDLFELMISHWSMCEDVWWVIVSETWL